MKRAPKAYKNPDFLHSNEARTLRILAEYLEPEKRFRDMQILHSIVFFGSARVKPHTADKKKDANYWAAEELAFQIGTWAREQGDLGKTLAICSGGGPGIMEAANRGALRANANSIGLNVSLPHEQSPNDFISPELNFEFHYFFMRKLWFLYYAKALICFPGGFGTLDEMFETLTLVQTRKVHKNNLSIILYNREYWKSLINFDKLVDMGYISPEDLNLFHYIDSVQEGMDYLKPRLIQCINSYNDHNGHEHISLKPTPIL